MSNSKNIDLELDSTKNKIMKYLHKNVSEISTKYIDITDISQIDSIRENPDSYIVCPRLVGTRSWVVITKIDDIYYAVNFPKHNINKRIDIKIFPIDLSVKTSCYNGTIMEGIYTNVNGNRKLVIDEVYIYSGQNQLLKSKKNRLIDLSKSINSDFNQLPGSFEIYVVRSYDIKKDDLKSLFEKIKSDKNKRDEYIQDIIFSPQTFGKNIYQYKILEYDTNDDIIKISIMRMVKLKSVDGYKLFTMDEEEIGLAYVSDSRSTALYKSWFKNKKTTEVFAKCKLDINKNRWMPFELVEFDLTAADIKDDDIEEINSDESE